MQSIFVWLRTFSGGVDFALLLGAGHGLSSFFRNLTESGELLVFVSLSFWKFFVTIPVCLGILIWLRKIKRDLPTAVISALLMTFFIALGWKFYQMGYYTGGTKYASGLMTFYLTMLLVFFLSVLSALIYQRRNIDRRATDARRRLFLIAAILFFLPFAGAVGTANQITSNILYYMAPWICLFLLFLIGLAWLQGSRWIVSCGAGVIGMFACAQVITGEVMYPYRLNTGIIEQTIPTNIGFPFTNLSLDQATSDFFRHLYKFAYDHGFKPGDDVLAFSSMPGIVFSLGGKSPSVPWYSSGYNGSRTSNEMALSLAPIDRLKKAFILQNDSGADGFPDLSKFGIDFPNNYHMCGEAFWPATKDLVKLWKPK